MSKMWMVRAGRGGAYVEDFLARSIIAIGWNRMGELNDPDRESLGRRVAELHPECHTSAIANFTGILEKFRSTMVEGDRVVTYNPERRIYYIGTVIGPYRFDPEFDMNQIRPVRWDQETSRDDLTNKSRNSLGSTLTLFSIKEETAADLLNPKAATSAALNSSSATSRDVEGITDDEDDAEHDMSEQSLELIKDRVLKLDDREMEELMAGILKAMGYKSQVNPVGPDRGIDVTASPDGLGLEQPRIKAEVKHRPRTQMGAQHIRNFIGALRPGDSGIYLSTGGFSKEARYEADRSNVPVKLLSLNDLVQLITDNYDNFDDQSRLLVPLVRVWWPA